MDSTRIQHSVATLREGMSGEYSSATRVVDALLDLRLLATDTPDLVEFIDSALLDVPGWFVATNDWWSDQLDRIDRLASSDDSDRATTAPTTS